MASKAKNMKFKIKTPQLTGNYSSWRLDESHYFCKADLSGKLEALADWAVNAPSSHNTQPWGFYVDEKKKKILVVPDMERTLPHSDPSNREFYISIGAATGTLKIAARRFGWKSEAKFKKNDKSDFVYSEIRLDSGYEPSDYDVELFNAITQRINYDGDHLNTHIPEKFVKKLQKVFVEQKNIEFMFIEDQPRKNAIAKLIHEGDIEIFKNDNFVEELVMWVRDASTTRKDGILSSKLGLPKNVRRFASKLLLNLEEDDIKNMADSDKNKIKNSAGIGVIASKKESPEVWMKIGELYQIMSLLAVQEGIFFGARGVLIETGNLHKELERVCDAKGRAQMMFRVGYPASSVLEHAPRYFSHERSVFLRNNKPQVVSTNKPTVFHLSQKYDLDNLKRDLGKEIQVLSKSYSEHWLPDLFDVLNPSLVQGSSSYDKKLKEFVNTRDSQTEGVWVYDPSNKTLAHLPDEEEFYLVITANNSRKISKKAQQKIKKLKIGVCGLSGSGMEAVMAMAMSGAKNFRLADFDFVSPRNINRLAGKVGENKAWSAAWSMWSHNPFLGIEIFEEGLTDNNVDGFVKDLDIIVEQTDSPNKFRVRKAGKEKGAIVVQITDMPDPIVDIELPKDPDFGGRAQKLGITQKEMEGIDSIGESTAYLPILMDPEKVPAEAYKNFKDLVEGRETAYSQAFIGAQGGGAALGRVFLELAEGREKELPRSFVVNLLPVTKKGNEAAGAVEEFWKVYRKKYGDRFEEFYEKVISRMKKNE